MLPTWLRFNHSFTNVETLTAMNMEECARMVNDLEIFKPRTGDWFPIATMQVQL